MSDLGNQPQHDRRQHARAATRGIECLLGEITDLSVAGMSVFRKGGTIVDVGDEVEAELAHETLRLRIRARVVHIEKVGLRRRLIGLAFVDPTVEQKASLYTLMANASEDFIGPRCFVAA